MMKKTLTVLLILLLGTAPVFAITDEERAALLRASAEILMVEAIVEEAEQAKNDEDTKPVQYQEIKNDLEKIKQGLLDVINDVRREPRALPPISGDYQ
ncbi:MAG: RAQPRD family integrative conjugative element protein [Proteobacteria bacterium]|nr:RAQPRD family integrative conjugative element protein [Pseudomonadota bacterium]